MCIHMGVEAKSLSTLLITTICQTQASVPPPQCNDCLENIAEVKK